MSKFATDIEELERRDARAHIVSEHGRDGVSYLDYRRVQNPRVEAEL